MSAPIPALVTSDAARPLSLDQLARPAPDFGIRRNPPGERDARCVIEGVEAPIPGRDSERRSWFVYTVRLAPGADRDATIARLAERGIASKAYLPCIHLFPHLRELGYREGQFPVAEAAAADSLALPFFPGIAEGQVERVCQELAAALGRPA